MKLSFLLCQPIFFVRQCFVIIFPLTKTIFNMQLAERDFIVGGHKIGTIPFYTNIDPILEAHKPGTRVLPAAFFYERGGHFELIKRHEPGEYALMPNGGFEISADGGSRRYYDLNQVIVHPSVAKHRQALDLMERKEERDEKARVRSIERGEKVKAAREEGARRGRPAMDPAAKAQLEADKAQRASKSGGKRGRPKSTSTALKTPKTPGGKRGRKPLDPSIREARAREAVVRTAKSGGKRGRPKRG
jgi:hypothetical protein